MKKTKNKNRDAQKKRTSHKAVESVLRPEGSLWWERFVKKKKSGMLPCAEYKLCNVVNGLMNCVAHRKVFERKIMNDTEIRCTMINLVYLQQ